MITILRAEYETKQAQMSEQKQKLDTTTAELAQALLQNRWLMEQLKLKQMVMEQFAHLFEGESIRKRKDIPE